MLAQPHGCNHGYCGVKDELIVVEAGATLLVCVDHVTADGSVRGDSGAPLQMDPGIPGQTDPLSLRSPVSHMM